MKTFEEEIKRAIDNVSLRPGLEGVGYDGGFIDGLEYAQELLDIHRGADINEILMEFQEWSVLIPAKTFAKWDKEEGDFDDTQARIRKEFIKYINQK